MDVYETMKAEHNTFMLGPNAQFQSETSSVVMNLNAIFHLRGINLCIGAACASGSHAIGFAKLLHDRSRELDGRSKRSGLFDIDDAEQFRSAQYQSGAQNR